MNGKWSGIFVLVMVGTALVSVSCAHNQQLVSIAIQPQVETFGASNVPVGQDAGLNVQLRALGTYIHPPVTKDITNQVTWASNDTQMMTVDSTGLLTATGVTCGGTLVSATVTTNSSEGGISSSGSIVTGYMTGNVVCYTGTNGGGGIGPALTATFDGNGSGNVTSNPAGVSCASPSACVGQFETGTLVTLTATPIGTSVFGTWTGCDSSPTTNPCTLTMTENRTVTATFN